MLWFRRSNCEQSSGSTHSLPNDTGRERASNSQAVSQAEWGSTSRWMEKSYNIKAKKKQQLTHCFSHHTALSWRTSIHAKPQTCPYSSVYSHCSSLHSVGFRNLKIFFTCFYFNRFQLANKITVINIKILYYLLFLFLCIMGIGQRRLTFVNPKSVWYAMTKTLYPSVVLLRGY